MLALSKEVISSDIASKMHDAIIEAGQLALSLQADCNTKLAKQGRDFATEADLAVQKQIISNLSSTLPKIPLVGEEDKAHDLNKEQFIVIDPIDGTFLYSAGSNAWGITMALVRNGRPEIGFIYQPARKQLIYAEKGQGCFLGSTRIMLKDEMPLESSIIGLVQGCWNSKKEMQEVNVPLSLAALFALCPGSAVDAGFELLTGVCSAYLNYHGSIWDFAGLAIAVEEAGGLVCAPNGAPRSWNEIETPCLFAAGAAIQKEVLELIPEEFRVG